MDTGYKESERVEIWGQKGKTVTADIFSCVPLCLCVDVTEE